MANISGALKGLSEGLSTAIGIKFAQERDRVQQMREENMERIRQANRIEVVNLQDVQAGERLRQVQEYEGTRDETLNQYASTRDQNLFANTQTRDKTLQQYELEQIAAQGKESRSTAYLQTTAKTSDEMMKLRQRWHDQVNKLVTSKMKGEMLNPDDYQQQMDRLINQATVESGGDPAFVYELSKVAGEPEEVARARANAVSAMRTPDFAAAPGMQPGAQSPDPGSAGPAAPKPGAPSMMDRALDTTIDTLSNLFSEEEVAPDELFDTARAADKASQMFLGTGAYGYSQQVASTAEGLFDFLSTKRPNYNPRTAAMAPPQPQAQPLPVPQVASSDLF